MTSELNFHTTQYYFGEDRVFIYTRDYEKIPSYVGKALIPQNKLKFKLPNFPQKAFIIKDDLSYTTESLF